jgi:heptosyltransferase-2
MKFLIIQTAFIGDVVLATSIVEKLKFSYPEASIDFLLRKGNESLLIDHPHLRQVLVFDKKMGKYKNLFKLLFQIRSEKYDYVINAQRFLASGVLTAFSGAKHTIGFNKNPLSFLFSKSIDHSISANDVNQHEVKRNHALIEDLTDSHFILPRLYPSNDDFEKVKQENPYVCIAPASVWYTKQWPAAKWIELINKHPEDVTIFLLGAKGDITLCNEIMQACPSRTVNILAGQLSFLESAALMKHARMNFVNDSAPLHFATAVNAPVTVIYCSTVPSFGFGPLSDHSHVFETSESLDCRPCGLHGYKACPKGHFKCADIDVGKVLAAINM